MSQLELLITWSSFRAFHKFIAKQVEQRRITLQDTNDIQDQANTFFRHSDLRNSTRQAWTGHGHEFWIRFNISAVVRHLLASRASRHSEPNAFGTKVLVPTSLLIDAWRILLADYHDKVVAEILAFGWPINRAITSFLYIAKSPFSNPVQFPCARIH